MSTIIQISVRGVRVMSDVKVARLAIRMLELLLVGEVIVRDVGVDIGRGDDRGSNDGDGRNEEGEDKYICTAVLFM